jgi:hypothetical protein
MSLTGASLSVHNPRADQVAAQITQAPDSDLPALAVGGDTTLNGSLTVTGTINSTGGLGAWTFDVRSYGARGNGQAATDGAITSGSNVLTLATSRPFKPEDVGKYVMIKGALTSGATTLVTTITRYTSPSKVMLGANATNTVTGALVLWASDDTAAIQRTINAAFAYGQAHGVGIVWVPRAAGTVLRRCRPAHCRRCDTKANGQLIIPIQATTDRQGDADLPGRHRRRRRPGTGSRRSRNCRVARW